LRKGINGPQRRRRVKDQIRRVERKPNLLRRAVRRKGKMMPELGVV